MKNARIVGAVALVLAILVAVAGVLSATSQPGQGPLGGILAEAQIVKAEVDGDAKAMKNATSTGKKANNALTAAEAAATAASEAQASVAELKELVAAENTGESQLDTLLNAVTRTGSDMSAANEALKAFETSIRSVLGTNEKAQQAMDELKGAVSDLTNTTAEVQSVADSMVMELFTAALTPAQEAIAKSEENINSALAGARTIYDALGSDAAVPEDVTAMEAVQFASIEEAEAAAQALVDRAAELSGLAQQASQVAGEAVAAAQAAAATSKMTFAEKLALTLQANVATLFFTAGLLLVIALVLLLFAKPFFAAWKKNPVVPVFVVLLGMLVFQTYALGFNQPTVGAWFAHWGNNIFNVLRANTSVGMIALGMTLVIITGGIDLAVGSTLAGIGTVMMVLMDTSSAGILTRMGITGIPMYIIGILGGILTGVLLGLFTGVAVTKGGVPPFIVTLGTMNIVRSVAQYFTQSYSPKIPDEFCNISNTVIFGQRLLPIVYWLILAVVIYVISKHTAFGRHIYAVGSNERTTKLSGINVDRVKIKVYALMGFIVSIAAVVQLARLGGMDVASAGSGYEMDAIAATVVGGTSMAGGKGSIIGTVLGVLIIGLMNNILILLGVDAFLTNAFKGAIVLLAVLMQRKEKAA